MTTNIKLYSFDYAEAKTYLWAVTFVVANMVLPQVFHLLPQGGIVFAPLSFVILAGAYKLGWKTGLLAAWNVVPVMALKLVFLALAAGVTAQYFKRVTLPLLIGVVLTAEALGGLGELALTGGIAATVTDFTLGWPGLLLQVFGTLEVLHLLKK